MNIIYEAHASATGGRSGHVTTDDGALDLQLSLPKSLGGSGGAGTNPEQLFAGGYAACFENALIHVARQQKITLEGTRVDATVGIGPNDQGGFALAVKLVVTVPGLPREQAQALVEQAHAVCPYSNAIRGNVDVALELR
ncbi:organic hydroperoxide resistance protein [Marinobacter lutaoensis]|jgi:Ohr subfamily peroxiredoxin|uniref:organic hydroperoxide resistance protein n=1 Tax=Marinobacter lutaoensis TaxID=135739 RepID=UPI001593D5C4|nr:organic hydroperoxide resistance protein [Marinobacter lutaoensis]NVD34718.1 organic hydroperoxide resistance protein [Marinobacter lutaoensis]